MKNVKILHRNIALTMTLGIILMMVNTLQANEPLLLQTTKITGKVTDAYSNVPLAGVSVQIKGTSVKTVTKKDGTYSIDLPKGGKTIVINNAGYKILEIDIKGRKVIDASMSQLGASNALWE
jgi:TonB-dependent starch-binding outer membrane protein SusC